MMHSNPYLILLGALDFSVADLYTNRRGELSDVQRARLRHQRLKQVEVWLAGIVGLIVVGLAFEAPLLVVLFGVCTLVSVIMAVWIRAEDDLQSGIHSAAGKVTVAPRRLRPSQYDLWVGTEHFSIAKTLKDALDTRYAYRVYFTGGSRTIVSAEMAA